MSFDPVFTTALLSALLAISEVIALTPLKSNSIFQLIQNMLSFISGKD